MRHAIFGLVSVAALTVAAGAAEPVDVGKALLNEYCSGCHAIEKSGESPHIAAPAFRDLHLRYDVGDLTEGLVEGLVSGHPDMPEFAFSPEEADAIVAYLRTLEAK